MRGFRKIATMVLAATFLLAPRICVALEGRGLESVPPELLKDLGDIHDTKVTATEFILPGEGYFLQIDKLGEHGESKGRPHPLGPCKHLTLLVVQGKGMGVSPRLKDGPEGLQIRVWAKGPSEEHGYSVSYTIPDGSASDSKEDPAGDCLLQRVDRDSKKRQMGYLSIRVVKPEK
ncbi:hypothetical protein [Haloferula sp. BvORR071]|uniref:hypothetical protein n=1 Tax=Haloferula sp. BvORR071 TaxID=1396141 RepID=UPI002240F5DA|nr:hypothetical protein [Haloferula sp. BvORR071]